MKKRDKAIAIAVAKAQLEAAKAIVVAFGEAFAEVDTNSPQFEIISDAWNAAHDMVRALEGAEHQIEMQDNMDRIIASGQYESYRLAAQNID